MEEVERRGLDEQQESDAASDDEAVETKASFEGNVRRIRRQSIFSRLHGLVL
jgi:hypothetical protein